MGLFDKIGDKISTAGQGVASQTKNLTEIAKLNIAISNNEKSIVEIYTTIGQLYYEHNGNNPETFFQEHINKINELYKEISSAKEACNILKGVTLCSKCGHEVASKNKFCNHCGNKVESIQNLNTESNSRNILCNKCNVAIEPGNKFCFNCGESIEESAKINTEINTMIEETNLTTNTIEATPEIIENPISSESTPIENSINSESNSIEIKCENCSSVISSDMKFCNNCGSKVVN